ncbi:FAD-dependent oxidoreductase [Nocardioides humi]|uniref:FAD-dependent oxidoreductase n=1 Tax=Nocardioides humi TaxID=449461 RepID=A0ABN2ABZ8_9ACTN|nr:FAD-dependent oxidoreductase [Nocardioides humi]
MADLLLLQPFEIGGVSLRNRVVMPPMGSRHTPGGLVSATDLEWHAERAHGGVGLVITGGTSVHPTSVFRGNRGLDGWRAEGVPGLSERVDAVHAGGAKIFGQLLHLGRETIEGQPELAQVAPSAVRSPRDPFVPHEMSRGEVREIVDAFAVSAAHHLRAGYDGLEVHAAHGYLVAQFLSPDTNRRTDEYGGDTPVERTAFLREILERVRAEAGSGVPVGVRLSAHEESADGIQLGDTLAMVRALTAAGLVDYVSITRGVRNGYIKDNTWPYAVAADEARAIKQVCDVPVLVSGRIVLPEHAESVLSSGAADLVGVGRGLIADPDWVAKASGRKHGAIRPCIGFVQDCRIAQGGAACAVNAGAGREAEFGTRVVWPPVTARVVVVGGGPGGLEAARLAAERGCRVTLFEGDRELGGQLRRAARGPGRGQLLGFVDFLGAELDRLGVEVVTGRTATADDVAALAPDQVVVATGAVHAPVTLPGADRGSVLSVWELLDGTPRPFAGHVVVADDGTGFWPAVSAAELLLAQGAQVTFVTPAPAVAGAVPRESLGLLHRRLRRGGTTYRPFTVVDRVGVGTVDLRDVVTGQVERASADHVVALTTPVAQDGLVAELAALGVPAAAIGDAIAPRRITAAVLDANRLVGQLA